MRAKLLIKRQEPTYDEWIFQSDAGDDIIVIDAYDIEMRINILSVTVNGIIDLLLRYETEKDKLRAYSEVFKKYPELKEHAFLML